MSENYDIEKVTEEVDIVDIDLEGNVVDVDLDFDLTTDVIDPDDLAQAALLNQEYRNQDNSFNYEYDSEINTDENKSKFKTLIYLNRKISISLQRELKTLKRDIIEAYELTVKSSVIEYEDVFENLVKSNSGDTSEFNTVVGNTIYQYQVHNLSVDNIVDNLSIRLAFSRMNGHLFTGSQTSASLRTFLQGYKHHMEILVPIVIDKLNDSWYQHLLNQYDLTLGLLTPTLFKSYSIDEIHDLILKEAESSFNASNSSKKIDNEILAILSEGFEKFRGNITGPVLQSIFDVESNETLILNFLDSLQTSDKTSGHIKIQYPALSELCCVEKDQIKDFSKFYDDHDFNEQDKLYFTQCITLCIASAMQEGGKKILSYRYNDDSVKVSAGKGTVYNDLSIPALFQNWLMIYHRPFSDREIVNGFLKSYLTLCENSGIMCSLDKDNPLQSLLSNKVNVQEYSDIVNYLNKAIYSRVYPIASVAEYIQYVKSQHSKLEIPEPLFNTNSDDIFFGSDYLSSKLDFIDTLSTDVQNDSFTVSCSCGSTTYDSSTNDMVGTIYVPDYLTVIRMDPNNSINDYEFNLEDAIQANSDFAQVSSNKFEDLGLLYTINSDLVSQELVVCENCGKVHLFPEKIYRALDICAQKFISDRVNSEKLKFVQRCTLSRECVEEFESEFYSCFDSLGNVPLDNLPLDLPKVEEKEREVLEEKKEDFSAFDKMALDFISVLSKNKEQYKYESDLRELMIMESYSKQESVIDSQSILESFEEIQETVLEDKKDDSTVSSLSWKKSGLDKKYYNNFIWYFLSNNLIENMDAEKLVKLRISEIFGRENIIHILNTYNEMKKTLTEVGRYQFELISDLNNSELFPAIDIIGNPVDSNLEMCSVSDDAQHKLRCKYINMGKRALLNSDNRDEFVSNINLCSIDNQPLSDAIKKVLLDEYDGDKSFDYSNERLLKSLSKSMVTGKVSRRELNDRLISLREEISDIVESVDYSTDKVYKDNYIDFNLTDFCIILGSVESKKTLTEFDYSECLEKIDSFREKFIARLDEKFNGMDEGAINYFNYLLAILDYDCTYEKVKNTEVLDNLFSNYCLLCREYIEPTNDTFDLSSKLSSQFNKYCIAEIDNNLSAKYHKRILSETYALGATKIIDSMEEDFKAFAFRILETYGVNLYNPRLVNSTIGKGINKILKALQTAKSEDEIDKVMKSYPSMSTIFPRIGRTPASNSIKNHYSNNPNKYKFKVVDSNGSVINNNFLLDKVRTSILCMFMLMDTEYCTQKDSVYERDIFKLFNLIFSLPSSFLNEGIRENFKDLNLREVDNSYDLLHESITDLCENQNILDCVLLDRNIDYSLEKGQLDELIMLSKLCLDTTSISYKAARGLITSEKSAYV